MQGTDVCAKRSHNVRPGSAAIVEFGQTTRYQFELMSRFGTDSRPRQLPLRRPLRRLSQLFGSPTTAGHSEKPLRILVGASIVFPLIIFAIAAYISYDTHFKDAQDRLTNRSSL